NRYHAAKHEKIWHGGDGPGHSRRDGEADDGLMHRLHHLVSPLPTAAASFECASDHALNCVSEIDSNLIGVSTGDASMNALNELRAGLCSVAKRSVGLMSACGNEESTKLYLVLPIIGLFGYDYSNPYEVYPQHAANADPKEPNRVDLAVLREGSPVI